MTFDLHLRSYRQQPEVVSGHMGLSNCDRDKPRLHKPFIAGLARVQRALKCLHMSRSARFQDESVLAQLGLGNCVRPGANPGQV